MFAGHLGDALTQIRQLQQAVVERQRFRGYSGRARLISGTLALVSAALMTSTRFPVTTRAHVFGWGAVFVAALILNSAALIYWFFNDPRVGRDIWRLRPIVDSVLPLLVGGVLTFALIVSGSHDQLFGIWMCMFGLSNLASRHVLPRLIGLVGAFYVICGVAWLLFPGTSFLNPWPMGIVFFAGEWAGGLILHFDQSRYLSLVRHQETEEQEDEEENES